MNACYVCICVCACMWCVCVCVRTRVHAPALVGVGFILPLWIPVVSVQPSQCSHPRDLRANIPGQGGLSVKRIPRTHVRVGSTATPEQMVFLKSLARQCCLRCGWVHRTWVWMSWYLFISNRFKEKSNTGLLFDQSALQLKKIKQKAAFVFPKDWKITQMHLGVKNKWWEVPGLNDHRKC